MADFAGDHMANYRRGARSAGLRCSRVSSSVIRSCTGVGGDTQQGTCFCGFTISTAREPGGEAGRHYAVGRRGCGRVATPCVTWCVRTRRRRGGGGGLGHRGLLVVVIGTGLVGMLSLVRREVGREVICRALAVTTAGRRVGVHCGQGGGHHRGDLDL